MEGMYDNLLNQDSEQSVFRLVKVLSEITEELINAVVKFPEYPTDPLHALAILGEEYGELNKAVLQSTYEPHKTNLEEVKMEAIQTAAMAIRFILSLEEFNYEQSIQHKQEL